MQEHADWLRAHTEHFQICPRHDGGWLVEWWKDYDLTDAVKSVGGTTVKQALAAAAEHVRAGR